MMQTDKAHQMDKTGWPDGPWMHEPDREEWRSQGLPCLILRNRMGALCGYVGLPPGHPWRHYGSELDVPCEVHGGPSYLAPCNEDSGICHVPREDESDDVIWLGFDCAHSGDYAPKLEMDVSHLLRRSRPTLGETYRDIHYVRAEVEQLAKQAVDVMEGRRV